MKPSPRCSSRLATPLWPPALPVVETFTRPRSIVRSSWTARIAGPGTWWKLAKDWRAVPLSFMNVGGRGGLLVASGGRGGFAVGGGRGGTGRRSDRLAIGAHSGHSGGTLGGRGGGGDFLHDFGDGLDARDDRLALVVEILDTGDGL